MEVSCSNVCSAASPASSATRRPPHTPPAAADAEDRAPITAYDVHGQQIQISRAAWREQMLLPQLQAHWQQPDALYSLIVDALNDGFVADVEPASAQLLTIDPNLERGHVIRAVVLMELGALDEAERVLRAAISEIGQSATLLTNLAKVQDHRGDTRDADATLWTSLQLDPNQDNGLGWWLARERDRMIACTCAPTPNRFRSTSPRWVSR